MRHLISGIAAPFEKASRSLILWRTSISSLRSPKDVDSIALCRVSTCVRGVAYIVYSFLSHIIPMIAIGTDKTSRLLDLQSPVSHPQLRHCRFHCQCPPPLDPRSSLHRDWAL